MEYNKDEIQYLADECLKNPTEQLITTLGDIMRVTNDSRIIRIISLSFADIDNPIVLPILINKILTKETYKNGRASLVYACEEFDCTLYLNLFFNLALYDTAIVSISSIEIIGNMEFDRLGGCVTDFITILKGYISTVEDESKVKLLQRLLILLEINNVKCNNTKILKYIYLDLF